MALTNCVRRGFSWKPFPGATLGTKVSSKLESRLLSTVLKSQKVTENGQRVLLQPTSWYSTKGHRGIQREKPKDLYAILDVSPSATQQQVKDAYYKLSLKFHPDRNQGSVEAHQKFTDLTEAYSILGQYELRKKYDKGLLHQYPGRHHTTHEPSQPAQARRSTRFVDKDRVKFDFDEFYKAHYGDALKRQRDNKKKEAENRLRSTYYSVSDSVQQLMIIGVALAVLGIGLFFVPLPKNKMLKKSDT